MLYQRDGYFVYSRRPCGCRKIRGEEEYGGYPDYEADRRHNRRYEENDRDEEDGRRRERREEDEDTRDREKDDRCRKRCEECGEYLDEDDGRRYGRREGCEEEEEGQEHVHEFEGSTKLAELREDPHNHRTAGVSAEKIRVHCGHIHKICTRTDFFEDHFHFIVAFTGLQIPVGGGKHVHFVKSVTTVEDGHRHPFQLATAIDDPLSPTPMNG